MSDAPARLDPAPPVMPAMDAAGFQGRAGASDAQLADMVAFRDLLATWNEQMNLVGPSALANFWDRHAWDSAQLLNLMPDAKVWADLGAGAGFPGLVLAVMLKGVPGAKVHLVESLAKRCRFLSAVVSELDLPAQVHNARAESLKLDVEVVTARAVAPLARLLEYGWPYLKTGAVGLFLKGRDAEAEVAEAARYWKFSADLRPSLSDPGGRVVEIREISRVSSV
ncbi:MAG: rsmG [Caulobacter sp.]|nr:rsmG [Caulobacter sp.]